MSADAHKPQTVDAVGSGVRERRLFRAKVSLRPIWSAFSATSAAPKASPAETRTNITSTVATYCAISGSCPHVRRKRSIWHA